jgi:hypothetical protein
VIRAVAWLRNYGDPSRLKIGEREVRDPLLGPYERDDLRQRIDAYTETPLRPRGNRLAIRYETEPESIAMHPRILRRSR